MNNSIDLPTVDSAAFKWDEHSMSDTYVAQETSSIDLSDINLSTITITGTAAAPITTSYSYTSGSSIITVDPYEEMETRLQAVEKIIAEEKAIRDKCPAVKQAYDEYKLLLELARGPLTDL